MAHNKNDQTISGSERASGTESGVSDSNVVLNRRNYVKAGAATVSFFTMNTATAASDTVVDGNRYWTDFSDGQL